jgi:transposase
VVERAFRFLKDSSFAISDVFLKKIGRIEALGMMMVLMLAVYSIGEYQLRKRLAERGATVLNQVGKPTAKPTLRWVLTFFDGVAESYRFDTQYDSASIVETWRSRGKEEPRRLIVRVIGTFKSSS